MASKDDLYSFKIALSSISEFDGYNISIHDFLDECENALSMIDSKFENGFIKLMRSKLKGEAYKSIIGQQFLCYKDFKLHLLEIFRPHQTIYQLIGKIGNDFQRDDENVIKFYIRIKQLNRQILNIALCQNKLDEYFESFIEKMVIECFIRGLSPKLQYKINNSYSSLNDAMFHAIKIERNINISENLRKNSEGTQSIISNDYSKNSKYKNIYQISHCSNVKIHKKIRKINQEYDKFSVKNKIQSRVIQNSNKTKAKATNYNHEDKISAFNNNESIDKFNNFHKQLTSKCQKNKAKFYQISNNANFKRANNSKVVDYHFTNSTNEDVEFFKKPKLTQSIRHQNTETKKLNNRFIHHLPHSNNYPYSHKNSITHNTYVNSKYNQNAQNPIYCTH